MKVIVFFLAVFVVLAGYQTTSLAGDKKVYTKVTDNVRSVALMDSNGGVIGKRFELKSEEWNAWFEAVKGSDGWELTEKGNNDENKRIEFCEGSCAYQDKTCP
jgi:hypothetical protein